jgi:GTP-binding protein HflX
LEKAILVGIEITSENDYYENSLNELEELVKTAEGGVIHKINHKREKVDSTFYVGRGIIEELKFLVEDLEADMVVFNDELSGSQIRNIEDSLNVKIIDRTMLILDIFSKRAISKEGKLQVELAQLKYRLPRLTGLGNKLSRLGGGIGTRGPGEKKLESDRRHIRRRINHIEEELSKVKERRESTRSKRKKRNVFLIALVGYTNAGKSTLINKLCDAHVFTEDKLFATLDPTSRKLELENHNVVIVDTVGFINKLPHDLIESFKSTLEEVKYADAYIHVIDGADSNYNEHIKIVNKLLNELNAGNKPSIGVVNKSDINEEIINIDNKQYSFVIKTSAKNGVGIDSLKDSIKQLIEESKIKVNLFIPYGDEKIISFLHEFTNVTEKKYSEKGVEIESVMGKEFRSKVKKYIF